MGIFDFFKKKKVDEVIAEKLAFSEIETWIEKKIKENAEKEKEILILIQEKIADFIKELKEKIVILENFDLKNRKEEERIKEIVIKGKEKYVESVEELIEKLNDLEENKLNDFIEKINKIFLEFNKSSYKNYERATVLIGKEMASIKKSIKAFSTDLLKIYEENKDVVDFSKIISQIKLKFQSINPIEDTLKEITKKKLSLNEKISEKEKENKILNEKVEEIKKSQSHLDFLASQKNVESLKLESRINISELKQLLDFKALANFFHINEGQMKILKNHNENFHSHFLKDEGKSILILLDEAKLNNDRILEKINIIRAKTEEAKNYERDIGEDETQGLYSDITGMIIEIGNLKMEKVKEGKRNEKILITKEELIDSLKHELGKMNVEIKET